MRFKFFLIFNINIQLWLTINFTFKLSKSLWCFIFSFRFTNPHHGLPQPKCKEISSVLIFQHFYYSYAKPPQRLKKYLNLDKIIFSLFLSFNNFLISFELLSNCVCHRYSHGFLFLFKSCSFIISAFSS